MSKVRFLPGAYLTEADIPADAQAGFYLVQDGRKIIHIKSDGERVEYGKGGDIHNLGVYASLAELQGEHPVATPGDYATVIDGDSPKMYIWDGAANAWVDSGISGEYVRTVNNKTGPNVTLGAGDVGAPTKSVFDALVGVVAGKQERLNVNTVAALEAAKEPDGDTPFMTLADFGTNVLAGLKAAPGVGAGDPFAVRSQVDGKQDKPVTEPINIYVSPEGSDETGSGTEANPYRTLQRALDAVPFLTDIPPTGVGWNIIIWLQPGTYELDETLRIYKSYGNMLEIGSVDTSASNRAVITNKAGVALDTLIYCSSSIALHLKSLVIQGNGVDAVTNGVSSRLGPNVQLSYCLLKNLGNAVHAVHGSMSRVLSTEFENCTNGLKVEVGGFAVRTRGRFTDVACPDYVDGGILIVGSSSTGTTNTGAPTVINGGQRFAGGQLQMPGESTWIPISGVTTLPEGGTWARFAFNSSTLSGAVVAVQAGGSQAGTANTIGFAWKVAN